MSFSILPDEIKIKIFNMLSLIERYNASLVWEEMVYETWRSLPSTEDFIRKVTGKVWRTSWMEGQGQSYNE